jgi:hypothetical protein
MGPVTHDLYVVGVVILAATIIPGTFVPIFYGTQFPWKQFLEGKAVLISSTGLALLIDLAMLFRVIPIPLPVMLVIADAVYLVIFVGVMYKAVALIRNWRRSRRETPVDK